MEFSFVKCTIYPRILPVTIEFSFNKLTNVDIAVLELQFSLTMSQPGLPMTFISITVTVYLQSVSFNPRVLPLTSICVARRIDPSAISLLGAHVPLALVVLLSVPPVDPISMWFALMINAFIGVTVSIELKARALSQVV
jgi:hypothetical protein